jgi:hypothetical protein
LKRRQKYRNLIAHPQVAALIVDPDDPYRYVELRGDAEIDEEPTRGTKFIDEVARRYTGEGFGGVREGRVIVSVRPHRILTYRD